ncbi:MAG: hypothetical protein ABI675_01835 [Chitinophagaceae bacterium]
MLNEEEKNRILSEEQYRAEIRKKPKLKIDLIETITKILQGLAIIVGIWATYYAYQKQNKENKQRQIELQQQTAKEFRKSFYEKQFQYYAEAVETTSILATEKMGSEDYTKARKSFERLFWGKLSIVEEKTVESGMIRFNNTLKEYEQTPTDEIREKLKQASLKLAHDASKYTINVWVDSTERKNYNR